MDEIRANGAQDLPRGRVRDARRTRSQSARVAAEIRPDYLIGGTLIEPVQEILAGTGVRFFPYVGQIVGHPCLLRGSIDEIVADTKRAAELGVDGINLLAYRYDGDVEALTRAVVAATELPVICAGSVDSTERIRALDDCGAWAFTIGTAALDGVLVDGVPLRGQLHAALEAARRRPRPDAGVPKGPSKNPGAPGCGPSAAPTPRRRRRAAARLRSPAAPGILGWTTPDGPDLFGRTPKA